MTATTLSEPYRTSGSEHTDSVGRRGYAIGLMIASSVVISFTGLIVRHVDADPMVMNFYRALSLMVAVTLILAIQYRRMAITHVIRIGWPGIVGGVKCISNSGYLSRNTDLFASLHSLLRVIWTTVLSHISPINRRCA